MVTKEIYNIIVKETNANAQNIRNTRRISRASCLGDWKSIRGRNKKVFGNYNVHGDNKVLIDIHVLEQKKILPKFFCSKNNVKKPFPNTTQIYTFCRQ